MGNAARTVKLYSHPSCPWGKRVKRLLEDLGVIYQDYNVATDLNALREWMEKTDPLLEVPVVEIDGEVIAGNDSNRLREKLGVRS